MEAGASTRRACCYTNDANEKWWLLPVSRRTPLVFSEVLICLSYAAVVPPRGIAPRFAAPTATQFALRVWRSALPRSAFSLIGRGLCF